MKIFGDAGIFPFKLDSNARTQIWALVLPLIVALNCFFMRWHLWSLEVAERTKGGASAFAIDIDDSGDFYGLFFTPNASGVRHLFYICLIPAIYICLGLAVMLPVILYLRQRPVEQTKLFE